MSNTPVVTFAASRLDSVVDIDVVPDPVTAPLMVIVWLEVKYDAVSRLHVSAAVLRNSPDVPARAAIAVKSASEFCLALSAL
jgi:hypothetical protein